MRTGVLLALIVGVPLGGLVAAAPAPAHAAEADDRARAEQLHNEGLELARAGKYREAIARFDAALKLYPFAVTKHTLARAYEELGDLKTAHDWFRKALQDDYDYAPDARERIARIDAVLRRTHARLTVRTVPGNMKVVLTMPDGTEETQLSTPFETWVPAGTVKVVGTNPDFKQGQWTFTLVAGEDRTITLELQPLPRQGFIHVNVNVGGARIFMSDVLLASSPMRESRTHPVGTYVLEVTREGYQAHRENVVVEVDALTSVTVTMTPLEGTVPGGDEEPATTGVPSWVGATLIGAGAVSLLVGVVFHVEAFSLADEANAIPEGSAENDAEFRRLWSDAEDCQTTAAVSYVLATALIGTGVLLLALLPEEEGPGEPPSREGGRDLGVSFVPHFGAAPGYVGGGATLRF